MLPELQMRTAQLNTTKQHRMSTRTSTPEVQSDVLTDLLPAGRTRIWQSASTACRVVLLLLQAPIVLLHWTQHAYCHSLVRRPYLSTYLSKLTLWHMFFTHMIDRRQRVFAKGKQRA
jgi:hypothetical protein